MNLENGIKVAGSVLWFLENAFCAKRSHACVSADDDYIVVVRYASSLVDALLFIHYLAVILLEVRHLQVQFAVKVTRSPDGSSRTYTAGQLSVQRLASWCLDRYYRDFETYNPYLESVATRRSSRRMTEFKVCRLYVSLSLVYVAFKVNLVAVCLVSHSYGL